MAADGEPPEQPDVLYCHVVGSANLGNPSDFHWIGGGKKHTLLPFLGKLLGNFSVQTRVYGETFTVQGPYAGVLGWPAQCAEGDRRCWPDADKANMKEVMKGAKESGVHFKVPNGQGHF